MFRFRFTFVGLVTVSPACHGPCAELRPRHSRRSRQAPPPRGQSTKEYERKMWEAQHTARGDDDPKLDRIRMEALQTADAYGMAPCGEYTRLNLIAALTAYTHAWQARVKDCPRLTTVPLCDDKTVRGSLRRSRRRSTCAFSTPCPRRSPKAASRSMIFRLRCAATCCNSPAPACSTGPLRLAGSGIARRQGDGDDVSRTRCSVLHAAPQSRDRTKHRRS